MEKLWIPENGTEGLNEAINPHSVDGHGPAPPKKPWLKPNVGCNLHGIRRNQFS